MPKFRYALRPAKHVERLLIAELCRRLVKVAPLDQYSYVGFGALEFVDFELFHRTLGLDALISIEKDMAWPDRYEFNKPYKNITLLMGSAADHLPGIEWRRLAIVWLDYESMLTDEVIRDCETLARAMTPGSVLFVTVNAQGKYGKRFESLVDNVGPERIPDDCEAPEVEAGWGLAVAQRRILIEALEPIMDNRLDGAGLQQIANFHYADQARMQTVGWIITGPGIQQAIDACAFGDLPFSSGGPQPTLIKVPVLTAREVSHLNERLPLDPGETLEEPWLDEKDQADYAALYRYYPQHAVGL